MSPGGARGLWRRARTALTGAHAQPAAGAFPPALAELARLGPAALAGGAAPTPQAPSVAVVIPSFRRGSGGHATIVHLLKELQALGHEVSLWLEDWEGRHGGERPAATRHSFQEFFAAEGVALHTDFTSWRGADVVLATGWQTVARALLLGGARARAYLVQDHEPDFYAASAESLWAAATYRSGLHCIAASPWLAGLLRDRYGASASHFDLAVDHDLYHPGETPRQRELVAFYARVATPRRAVPLGLAALSELALRRQGVEVALYGEQPPLRVGFEHRHLGVLGEPRLAALYRQASVGMVLSLTNPSLVGLQMMACGLPCVELASDSMLATFGREGPLELAEPDPSALAAALEGMLEDPGRRARAAQAGVRAMAARTWRRAAIQLQEGLDEALAMASRGRR